MIDRYGMIYRLALYGWDKEVDGLRDGITVWGSTFKEYGWNDILR
jgi:hypothetical protein